MLPVDRASIVGIDEGVVPTLVALVEVGHPGNGEAKCQLRERDALTKECDSLSEWREQCEERLVLAESIAEVDDPVFPSFVRVDPVRVPLRLPECLPQVGREALLADRPCADQRLIDEQLLDRIRRSVDSQIGVAYPPRPDRIGPLVGDVRERTRRARTSP